MIIFFLYIIVIITLKIVLKNSNKGKKPIKNQNIFKIPSSTIKHTENYFINDRNMKLYYQIYQPITIINKKENIPVILMIHGYADSSHCFQRYTAIRLAKYGFIMIGIDLEGHGKSDGLHLYIQDFNKIVLDVLQFIKYIQSNLFPNNPLFLLGESMGGAICCSLCFIAEEYNVKIDGCILQAPMCKISENIKPTKIQICILKLLKYIAPTLQIVPLPSLSNKSTKLHSVREIYKKCPYLFKGKPRVSTAVELLKITIKIDTNAKYFKHPVFILHGTKDTITDYEYSKEFYEKISSKDKKIKLYEGMWHCLTLEPEKNRNIIFNDIQKWIYNRSPL